MATTISGDTGVSQCAPNSISADDFQAALFAASKTANGYQKLPSGLIIQWGDITWSTGTGTITFPLSFPTSYRLVISCVNVDGYAYQTTTGTTSVNVAGKDSSGAPLLGGNAFWIAIGY